MDDAEAYRHLHQLQDKLDGQLRFHIYSTLAKLDPEQRALIQTKANQPADSKTLVNPTAADSPKAEQPAKPASPDTSIQLASGNTDYSQDPYQGQDRMKLVRSQYYGMDMYCKRMLFIIDVSGSMLEAEYGVSRLDRAKQELIQAIQMLPEDSEFSVMVFSSAVNCWRRELLVASPANKRDAILYIRNLSPGSHTNTSGALQAAMDFDPSLEAIYLLTDGRPTIGPLINPQAIITDVVNRNRFRHLNINTIGIALDAQTVQFMQQLAALGAGEFKSVF